MIYFTADTHFCHAKIISSCHRPFATADEMDEALIANWNRKVTNGDMVYCLGDMFCHASRDKVRDILGRLKGKKVLVLGNHDADWKNRELIQAFFAAEAEYLNVSEGGRHLVMYHYPLLHWTNESKSWMIHGHIHNNRHNDYWPCLQRRERVLNAGVEINGYAPVTFEELVENNARQKALPPEDN